MVVVLGAVALMTGCSTPIPEATPMPTLEAGTWVSQDGQYSITLDENPNVVHVVLPDIFSLTAGRECVYTGVFPPTRSGEGSWTVDEYEYGDFLSLYFSDGAGLAYSLGQAREGDWAVILDYPCGPDNDPLYLVHRETAAPSG